MKTATVADLRNNFRRVSAWIEHGETVQIVKRGKAFARLTSLTAEPSFRPPTKKEIMARLKEVWGDKCYTMEEVDAMREAERAEDLG